MPPPELPSEIFDQIFSFLVDDAESLQACSEASKGMYLNAVVDRWLWRDVTVEIPSPRLSGLKGTQVISPEPGMGASQLLRLIESRTSNMGTRSIGQLIQVLRISVSVPSTRIANFPFGDAEAARLIRISPAAFVVAPLPSSSGQELLYPYSRLGPLLPNLRVLSLATISHTIGQPRISVRWNELNTSFRQAWLERLTWKPELDVNLKTDGVSAGIEEITIIGIDNFPLRILEQCAPVLKRLHFERVDMFNFSKVPPTSPCNAESLAFGKAKKSRASTNGRLSEKTGNTDVNAKNDAQKTPRAQLHITHLKLCDCSFSLSSLTSWLTQSSPGSDNTISNLQSLHFRSREMSDYTNLPRILEACKATLEELEVDLGNEGLFGLTRNLLPTSAKPPGPSQSSIHSSSRLAAQPTSSYPTLVPPGPSYFAPPLPTQGMLQIFPNSVLLPHPSAPTSPITIASAIPLSSLTHLKKLKIHTNISTRSHNMIISQGAEITMTRKYTSAVQQIGEILQAGLGSSETLKEIELRIRFRMEGGTNAPRLKDVDFSSVTRAFEHLDGLTESDALTSKRRIEGPLLTLAIHPALFKPSTSGSPERRIPFAELISDISNNKDMMNMVRAGRLVVKGKVLERIASVGSSTFGSVQGKEEERDRVWTGEVGWGH